MKSPSLPAADLVWEPDGAVASTAYGDVYASRAGAFAQARQVFVGGANLPAAWQGQPDWTILETGFGFGANFLQTLAAWREDPLRPQRLHHVAIEAHPIAPQDWQTWFSRQDGLNVPAAQDPPVQDAMRALLHRIAEESRQGLTVGFHHASFEQGRVRLTLALGDVRAMLRQLLLQADTVYLDGFAPARNPAMWSPDVLRAVGRLCRRGATVSTWCVARSVRDALLTAGFVVHKREGLPPKREALAGHFDPTWNVRAPRQRKRLPAASPASAAPLATAAPGAARGGASTLHAAVVGAGLAGAAIARALAHRGWRVDVFDAAGATAQGASGLPAGLFAPHVSRDDALLSQLTRHGLRVMREWAQRSLRRGVDWSDVGVLRRGADGTTEHHFPDAGWVRPTACVRAWLQHPSITVHLNARVVALHLQAGSWTLVRADGVELVAPHVVLATAMGSRDIAPAGAGAWSSGLTPVRGQVAWGVHQVSAQAPPDGPAWQGQGSVIPVFESEWGPAWCSGASYQRNTTDLAPRDDDRQANLARLHDMGWMETGDVRDWVGVRCTTPDRLPLVGPLAPDTHPGLCALTGLGSRGLTLAALCAELLASRLHGDPLPVPARLAMALDPQRLNRSPEPVA